jgi:DnaK suppressor protein
MARLNALPYATYCIKCQREAERQGAGSGTSTDVDWSRLLDSSGSDADLSINDIELDVS